MIGDPALGNYSVAVDVAFRGEEGGTGTGGVLINPCNAGDAAQRFALNSPLPGNLVSTWGGTPDCVTTCGCEAWCLQFFTCNLEGCAPPLSYHWTFTSQGTLTNAAFPGMALTFSPGNMSVGLTQQQQQQQQPSENQLWAFNPATGQVSLPAKNLCLSQSGPVDTRTFVFACTRAKPTWPWGSGFPGYCLNVFQSGNWSLVEGHIQGLTRTLAQGQLVAFNSSSTHRLKVVSVGENVSASLDGVVLASVRDNATASGSVFLGAGWGTQVTFDNFLMEAA